MRDEAVDNGGPAQIPQTTSAMVYLFIVAPSRVSSVHALHSLATLSRGREEWPWPAWLERPRTSSTKALSVSAPRAAQALNAPTRRAIIFALVLRGNSPTATGPVLRRHPGGHSPWRPRPTGVTASQAHGRSAAPRRETMAGGRAHPA